MATNNALHGYEKDDVNIKEAVYRVKNDDNTDKYSRIHFETNSKMIYDATSEATGNKVARRDVNGDIKFRNITSSGTIAANILTVINTDRVINLNADRVDGCHVNDNGTGTDCIWTANKINTTKVDRTTTVKGANGLTGGGALSANQTISHITKTPSKTLDTSGTSGVAIKSIVFDSYGHPESYIENNLDKRFPTRDEVKEQIANANITVTGSFLSREPSDRKTNGNVLTMENFTMQYNSTTQSIDFVFA